MAQHSLVHHPKNLKIGIFLDGMKSNPRTISLGMNFCFSTHIPFIPIISPNPPSFLHAPSFLPSQPFYSYLFLFQPPLAFLVFFCSSFFLLESLFYCLLFFLLESLFYCLFFFLLENFFF